MDIKHEAVKAVFWNIGALVDLLSVKALWRIACSKYPPLNPKGDLFHQASRSNQNLPSDTSWIQVRLLCWKMLAQRKPTSTLKYIQHSENTNIWRSKGLVCECMKLWSSLRCLIDRVACRTWQKNCAEWRFQGEGHLHVETALSHWGLEGSHPATLASPRLYMSMFNQAEQQILHLLQTSRKTKTVSERDSAQNCTSMSGGRHSSEMIVLKNMTQTNAEYDYVSWFK